MVLKYLTKREVCHGEQKENVFHDQWVFIGGIIRASVYWDEMNEATIADLEFESRPHMKVVLCYEAYLLSENGKTIEKVRA